MKAVLLLAACLPAFAVNFRDIHLASYGTPLVNGSYRVCIRVEGIDVKSAETPMFKYTFDQESSGGIYLGRKQIVVFRNILEGVLDYVFPSIGTYVVVIKAKPAMKFRNLSIRYDKETNWNIAKVECK